MKSYLLAVMCLLAAASANAQALMIDSCYAQAVANYPLIKQYDLIEKTKEYTLNNASKAYLPQLSLTAIEGYVFGDLPVLGPGGGSSSTGDFKFIGLAQINQTIWDGGATKTQKNVIKASAETDKATIDVSLNDLRSRVNELYFGILLVDEQLHQLEIQDSIFINNIRRIKLLKDAGLAYKTDVDELTVEQLKLHQQKKELTYVRSGYLTMLSFLTGARIGEEVVLERPAVSDDVLDAPISRPELSLYKSQRALINAQSGWQQVGLMPKIGLLGAGVALAPGLGGNAEASTIGVAGLSVSWNVGGLYRHSNEKQLTQLSLNRVAVQEELFIFNTKLQMTQASANIRKQKAILSDDEEIIRLRKQIRSGCQEKYEAGAGPLHDLLNAVIKEGEAAAQKALHETQLLKTLYDYKTTSGN